MTANIKLRYVHQWVDKRDGAAKPRYYFRRAGYPRTPLPGLPGSPEFMRAYELAITNQPPPIGAGRARPGSIDALAVAFYGSASWRALSPQTRATDRLIIEKLRKSHGDKPVALLGRQHINALLADRVETPFAANHWLRMIKTLMKFAVAEGWRKDDPTAGIKRIRIRSDGYHTWSEAEIAQFEAHHAVGSMPRLALALLLYTAQRRSDVVKMGPQHIRDGVVSVTQDKTGAHLAIPLHPELARIIEATPSGHLALLVTSHGHPFTVKGFGNWFRERCDEAGLSKQCSAHGLRKAACRRLAEAGCSANQIAAISGHKTLNEVARYTRAADQARLARDGMAAIARTSSGNRPNNVAKSKKKA
jgi:integrase